MLGQSVSTLQAVVGEVVGEHVPATTPAHDPAPAPGQVASSLHAAAAGPENTPMGALGDAHTDATYPNPPWMLIVPSWFGKHPAVPPV
jgi:hypothetical protein